MRKGEEENGGRRVRREGAFEDVVKNESGACVNRVLHKHEATTQRPWLRVVVLVKPQRFVQKVPIFLLHLLLLLPLLLFLKFKGYETSDPTPSGMTRINQCSFSSCFLGPTTRTIT